MSFRADVAKLRRELLKRPGIYPQPRCPDCGVQCAPKDFSSHTKQCERDCASEAIWAIDVRLAAIWSTEPRGPEHAACLEAETDWLREEHAQRFNELMGLDEFGRGRIHTGHTRGGPCSCGNPSCTHPDAAL